jgi:hypothetical protein
LFHYTTRENAQEIFATGVIRRSPASGPFPAGAYATDLAGWVSTELLTRSQLTEIIFGRKTPGNYAKTAWFVAFAETPPFILRKIAPFILHYPGVAEIIPLVVSPNLLGEN